MEHVFASQVFEMLNRAEILGSYMQLSRPDPPLRIHDILPVVAETIIIEAIKDPICSLVYLEDRQRMRVSWYFSNDVDSSRHPFTSRDTGKLIVSVGRPYLHTAPPQEAVHFGSTNVDVDRWLSEHRQPSRCISWPTTSLEGACVHMNDKLKRTDLHYAASEYVKDQLTFYS